MNIDACVQEAFEEERVEDEWVCWKLEMSWVSGVEEMPHRRYTTHVAATIEEVSQSYQKKSQSGDFG